MTHMERVLAALEHKETDYVPVYPILSGVTRKLTNSTYKDWATNSDICAKSLLAAQKEFDLDCIVTLIDLSVECDAWGQELIYPENEACHPNYDNCVIKDIEEYENIKKVDYKSSKRMMMHIDTCNKIVKESKGEYPVIAFVFGPLGTLSMLRSQQEMYMDFYDDPDAVHEAARQVNETLKEYCHALMQTGINGIMIDTLFSSGSIMSKDMWDELEGDLLEDLTNSIRNDGGLVFLHNCGERIYFDVQIKRAKPDGISFLYPPDDCKDFKECKEKYGKQVTLIGAVTPASVVISSDEDWNNECISNLNDMAKGGGFIFATGCEYPANASFDRAKEMVTMAKNFTIE